MIPRTNVRRLILTSVGGAGVAKFPSSGRSGGCPHAESAVLLHKLSVLPPPKNIQNIYYMMPLN